MQHNLTITEEEQEFIKNNYRLHSDRKIAKHLGLSQNKVYQNRNLMGCFRKNEMPPSLVKVSEEMFDHRKYRNFP